MNVLIAYDVATESTGGRRRLRKIAQACQDFGQRVQKSVFECAVNEMQFEELVRRLVEIIDEKEDSLRVYRLVEPKEKYVQVFGVGHVSRF
jgi:CRISPR-associated protein Cas2